MFDLDYLTNSMNYEPILIEYQANKSTDPNEANNSVGTQANYDQCANFKESDLHEEYFVLPIWSAYSTTVKSSRDELEKNTDFKTCEKPDANTNSTNLLNVVSTPISTAGTSRALNDGEHSYPDDPLMPHLEDIYASPSEGIFTDSSYDDEGVVTDFNNLETTMNKAIRTKWVYKNKKDERGVVVRNKARLVTQGHRQEEGIDYDEVFAPVARIEATRIFLAFASYIRFIVYQMDVKSAFLYGTIDEEVYVTQPPGFLDPKFPNKELMKNRFQMSSMGELTFFLGLHVKQKDEGIFISQDKYVAEILKKFDFLSVKTASTPIETQKPLVKDEEAADVDVYLYRYLKGQPKLGLCYPKVSSFDLESYSDSDYAGANLDKKSITGGCQFLGRRLISWQCKKQTIVAASTTEAEYVAAHCYGNQFTMSNPHQELTSPEANGFCKELASPKQTALEQTAAGKENSNPLMADSLPITILLTMLAYALMVNPTIYVSCIKQFWAMALIKKANDMVKLRALIDGKRVVVIEDVIRQALHLDGVDGVECLPNEEIFTELARMGYEKPPPNMVRNVDSPTKFLMYPRFLQVIINAQVDDLSSYTNQYTSPALTQKAAEEEDDVEVPAANTPPSPIIEPTSIPPQAQPVPSSPPHAQPQPDTFESSITLLNTLMETYATLSQKGRTDDVSASKEVSAVEPTIFNDEEVTMTMAQTLIKIKAKKARLLDEQMAKRLHDEEVEQDAAREKQEKYDFERDKESFKKLKAVEVSGSHSTQDTPTHDPKEMSKEDVKNMLEIVLVSEFNVKALQVKYPLID
nr:copia protein [Tanacetum cinerariifolium]GEZ53609.1 copia protein [Tanacetum cinerariifolium]